MYRLRICETAAPSICVVGAGIVGLTTAIQLQNEFPQSKITIIADKFDADTTSFGAAGVFRPMRFKLKGTTSLDFTEWVEESWRVFSNLAKSSFAGEAGCEIIAGYEFYSKDHDASDLQATIYSRQPVTEHEMSMFRGPKHKYGYRTTNILASPVRLLPFLMTKFKERGGVVVFGHLKSLEELVGKFKFVVNCCGLGAKDLVQDTHMIPVRGQVIKVEAPWIKTYYYAENEDGSCVYVYPAPDFVVVGGCKQFGDDELNPRKTDHDAIWQRACQVFPSLEKATQLGDWVGLRPARYPLRLEFETMEFKSGRLRVVHNYGHGGDGIALSFGTAAHAVTLVKQVLRFSPKL